MGPRRITMCGAVLVSYISPAPTSRLIHSRVLQKNRKEDSIPKDIGRVILETEPVSSSSCSAADCPAIPSNSYKV